MSDLNCAIEELRTDKRQLEARISDLIQHEIKDFQQKHSVCLDNIEIHLWNNEPLAKQPSTVVGKVEISVKI